MAAVGAVAYRTPTDWRKCSAGRSDRMQAREKRGRALAQVIADECVERRESHRGDDVDRVQRAKGRLGNRAGGDQNALSMRRRLVPNRLGIRRRFK
jgi:hypothetical protein